MDATEIANRGSRYCGKYSCITVTVYDSYDDGFGSGPQYWIDCAENLRPPEDISEFYRTMPEDLFGNSYGQDIPRIDIIHHRAQRHYYNRGIITIQHYI
ncbi:hypothetical protein BHE90_001464 [Fusarium euwallaceae]|uniref:Uncharacterized protein n=1 Tax=Fusarium euwallaceae TaxID=1147111 RepID=A0A430M7T7_9HYPO|nr:hypothetical protein BHE90_001464 [Fusarium euwallaceae]